jgi:hypothetical protein
VTSRPCRDLSCLQENQGLDFQAFFDLLQRLAEERGLMGELYKWVTSCATDTNAACTNISQKILAVMHPNDDVLLQTRKTRGLTIGCRWKPCKTWRHQWQTACVPPWESYVVRAVLMQQVQSVDGANSKCP